MSMMDEHHGNAKQPPVTDTVDQFIAWVPLSDNMGFVVFHRAHGGREYVRWRAWHRHREKSCWYPDRIRWGVISADHAHAFAEAMAKAAKGEPAGDAPDWLIEAEKATYARLARLHDVNAPAEVLATARRRWLRMVGEKRRKG